MFALTSQENLVIPRGFGSKPESFGAQGFTIQGPESYPGFSHFGSLLLSYLSLQQCNLNLELQLEVESCSDSW